jgi:glycosyltransferase involved in cell wall biosynthesis
LSGRTVFITYVYPPDESPRAVQIGRLVRHSGLEDLHIVCATQGAVGAGVHHVPWGRAARLRHAVRWKTARGRVLVPDAFRPWVRDAARTAGRLRPDVLVTFGQPMSDHLAGLALKRRTGIPWVAHFSDPWVDNPFREGSAPVVALNRRLEAKVLRGADRLVFTSEETVDLVMRRYPSAIGHKAAVVPHAFPAAGYGDVAAPTGRVVVRHLGAFYGQRSPAPLLRALNLLARRDPAALDDVHVELWGPFETPLEALEEHGRLPQGLVAARGRTSYAHSLELMRGADLLVVIDAPAEHSVFLPSKLVDYLGSRRPIVALTPPGASARIVEDAGGWVAPPEDAEAAADALAAALSAAREHRNRDWGNPELIRRYEPGVVARQMDDVVRMTMLGA